MAMPKTERKRTTTYTTYCLPPSSTVLAGVMCTDLCRHYNCIQTRHQGPRSGASRSLPVTGGLSLFSIFIYLSIYLYG